MLSNSFKLSGFLVLACSFFTLESFSQPTPAPAAKAPAVKAAAAKPVGTKPEPAKPAGFLPPTISFGSPKNGDTVTSPFKVVMKASGIKVRVAGEAVDETTSGHHHLLVNVGPIPKGQPIPVDDSHIHYGKAQTEAEVKLAPGKYKLTLQFADGAHRSYGPEMSSTIEVTVK